MRWGRATSVDFDEVQRGGVAGEAGAQEVFGQGACLRGSGGGAGGVFRAVHVRSPPVGRAA